MKSRWLIALIFTALLAACSSDNSAATKTKGEKKSATKQSEKAKEKAKKATGKVDSDFVLRGGFR